MDPLADLVDWIALYGVVGLLSIGLAERFVPALPSHGVLVAIGIAANDDAWSVHTAVAGTAVGSFIGALALYILVRAIGESKSVALLHVVGKWIGVSRQRIDQTLSSLRAREQTIAITSQLIPTVRLITPLAAALLGTSMLRFASGVAVGIVLWNGLFIAAGYLAVMALPDINSSAFALKILVFLVFVEALIAVTLRLQLRCSKQAWTSGDAQ
ncbi:membrane-associated protein [Rhizobium laguerreae]|uniref:DedA family protein n=1 Tax=Rhizobiaceae TaxID=82115 RepID=UPI000C9C6C1C|nr:MULTISPECIES: VTT domain-containing protein [Rhizobiaceae]MBY3473660.1 membrane-associated protein [Rhizobium laguerreae]MBY3521668.1 membrane-associated protein [Rhizobium laguerreae]PND26004.1 membrane-associated protein [Sinorhizobium sp. M4_45]